MVHFMAKRSHFNNFPAAFLILTHNLAMLQISFLAQTFQSLCLRKRINFTSTFYQSLIVITPILKLTLQEASADVLQIYLFLGYFIIYFCLLIRISGNFQCFILCFLFPTCVFIYYT